MANFQLSMLCLAITLVIYFLNKRLYRRFRKLPLMPLVLTPTLLVMLLVFGNISWQNYIGEAHWLLWLLGPATIAFAVPVYVVDGRRTDGNGGGSDQLSVAGAIVYPAR